MFSLHVTDGFFKDIWSLGVILFMLVCGRAPFYEVNDSETLINIMDVRYSVSDHVSQACQRSVPDDNNYFFFECCFDIIMDWM